MTAPKPTKDRARGRPLDAQPVDGRPLEGRRIAVLEHRELDRLGGMLEAQGAVTVRCPLVRIADAPDPAPVLASRRLKVYDWRTVGGEGKHLKLSLTDGRMNQDAIAFGQAQQWLMNQAAEVDVAYAVEWNEWKGERRMQLNVKSIQASQG